MTFGPLRFGRRSIPVALVDINELSTSGVIFPDAN
jgi:hypothetical protein